MTMNILIVDDNEHTSTAVRRLFHRRGHAVTVTNGVEAAVAVLVGGASFDLIVSDMMMADGTGIDLHRWIGETRPELLPRIVFYTGGFPNGPISEYLAGCGTEVILKPGLERILELANGGVP